MRYRLRHLTSYRYAEAVDLAAHLLHLSPRDMPGQRVLHHRILAEPQPARLVRRDDAYGNRACWLFLDTPHSRFEVITEAEVEVGFPPPAAPGPAADALAPLARRLPDAAAVDFGERERAPVGDVGDGVGSALVEQEGRAHQHEGAAEADDAEADAVAGAEDRGGRGEAGGEPGGHRAEEIAAGCHGGIIANRAWRRAHLAE